MFQEKIDQVLKEYDNVFGTADEILTLGFKKDGSDHNTTLNWDFAKCREKNLGVKCSKLWFKVQLYPFL